jgi:hypothetical protein
MKRRKGFLAPERAAALEAIEGWVWDRLDQSWAEGFAALSGYTVVHGTASVPQLHIAADGMRLGNWVSSQRAAWHRGRLSEQRAAALEALPGWTWSAVGVDPQHEPPTDVTGGSSTAETP